MMIWLPTSALRQLRASFGKARQKRGAESGLRLESRCEQVAWDGALPGEFQPEIGEGRDTYLQIKCKIKHVQKLKLNISQLKSNIRSTRNSQNLTKD